MSLLQSQPWQSIHTVSPKSEYKSINEAIYYMNFTFWRKIKPLFLYPPPQKKTIYKMSQLLSEKMHIDIINIYVIKCSISKYSVAFLSEFREEFECPYSISPKFTCKYLSVKLDSLI